MYWPRPAIAARGDVGDTRDMSATAPHTETSGGLLPDSLTLGPVHLTVTGLDRSADFYERAIGFRVLSREGDSVTLGTGSGPVLVLHEERGARPPKRTEAGLYHVALLYPSRLELARVAQRLIATRTPIQGASDHGTHEAFYLPDPDGNGLELAADRPREDWPDPIYTHGPAPLDVPGLMGLVEGDELPERAEDGLRTGHLHLHVGDVQQALAFYRDVIGFDQMADLGTAAFVSAGGYHHHLGLNTWRGGDPVPDGVLGMRHWTVELEPAQIDAVRRRVQDAGVATEDRPDGGFEVRDPWNNALVFRAR
jgi:catechol 2,3-dioxygenase